MGLCDREAEDLRNILQEEIPKVAAVLLLSFVLYKCRRHFSAIFRAILISHGFRTPAEYELCTAKLLVGLSITLTGQDVVLDVLLAISYLKSNYLLWGILELIFPAILGTLAFVLRSTAWRQASTEQASKGGYTLLGQDLKEDIGSRAGLVECLFSVLNLKPFLVAWDAIKKGTETEELILLKMIEGTVEAVPSLCLQQYFLLAPGAAVSVPLTVLSNLFSIRSIAEATQLIEYHLLGQEGRRSQLKDTLIRSMDIFSRIGLVALTAVACRPEGLDLHEDFLPTIPLLLGVDMGISLCLHRHFFGTVELEKWLIASALAVVVCPFPLQPDVPWNTRMLYQASILLWRVTESSFLLLLIWHRWGCVLLRRSLLSWYFMACCFFTTITFLINLLDLVLRRYAFRVCSFLGPLLPSPEGDLSSLHWAILLDALQNPEDYAESMSSNLDEKGRSPLALAVQVGYLPALNLPLECLEAAADHEPQGWSVAHHAAAIGQIQVLRHLDEKLPKLLQLPDRAGQLPVHVAATQNQAEVLSYIIALIPESANVAVATSSGKDGPTPALLAAKKGSLEVLHLLYEHLGHEGFNRADGTGARPSTCIVSSGNVKAVSWAIDRFADEDLGEWPLHMAAKGDHVEVFELMMSIVGPEGEPVHSLLSADAAGRLPLHIASESGSVKVMTLLESTDFGLDWPNSRGQLASHYAACANKPEVLTTFADKLCLHSKDDRGRTPAHYAAERNSVEALRTLVSLAESHHVDLHEKDLQGHTPLSLALANGHLAAARLLGADVPDGDSSTRAANVEEAHSRVVSWGEATARDQLASAAVTSTGRGVT